MWVMLCDVVRDTCWHMERDAKLFSILYLGYLTEDGGLYFEN